MALFDNIKGVVDSNIFANGVQGITGPVHNSVLKQVIDALGVNRIMVNPLTSHSPGTPQEPVAYIALPGTYPSFTPGVTVTSPIGIILWNGATWSVIDLPIPSAYDIFSTKTTASYESGLPYVSIAIDQLIAREAIAGQWVQLINRRTGETDQVQLAAPWTLGATSIAITSHVMNGNFPIGSAVEIAPEINMRWHPHLATGDGVNTYIDCPTNWRLPIPSTSDARIYREVFDVYINGVNANFSETPIPEYEYDVHESIRYRVLFGRVMTPNDNVLFKWKGPRFL